MDKQIVMLSGGVVAPKGFMTAGVACGIKQDQTKRDLALIVSEADAVAAGVFTTNVVKASCVLCNQETIKRAVARAVVINAGNANACNGEQGMIDAKEMINLAAKAVGVDASAVFCASTGVIGHPLPMDKIANGIEEASKKLQKANGSDATAAIMTTDTRPKEIAVAVDLDGEVVRIGAMAKGSGMIEPNMATMLCFITTDVAIDKKVLQEMFSSVVNKTFNAITVDGDTSTNDMCLVLANGLAANPAITQRGSVAAQLFERALHHVCLYLAKAIAKDGEGATKLVEIVVKNAPLPMKIAKTIANSPLVKTALFGNDPNWGRIIAAAGRSGAQFDPNKVDIALAGTTVFEKGKPTVFDAELVSASMKEDEIQIILDFHAPEGEEAIVWTCDFSYDYVKINADYHT